MIESFKTVIPVEGKDIEFVFHTMNVKRLQLFQVYVMHEGKKIRFHVQIGEHSGFKITDPDKCPEPYRAMSYEFSDAIYKRYPLPGSIEV